MVQIKKLTNKTLVFWVFSGEKMVFDPWGVHRDRYYPFFGDSSFCKDIFKQYNAANTVMKLVIVQYF